MTESPTTAITNSATIARTATAAIKIWGLKEGTDFPKGEFEDSVKMLECTLIVASFY